MLFPRGSCAGLIDVLDTSSWSHDGYATVSPLTLARWLGFYVCEEPSRMEGSSLSVALPDSSSSHSGPTMGSWEPLPSTLPALLGQDVGTRPNWAFGLGFVATGLLRRVVVLHVGNRSGAERNPAVSWDVP